MNGRVQFERRFYDHTCKDIPADVVICRHVIEHIQKPLDLLCTVKSAIGDNNQAKVYFETPCIEWIFKNNVVWDLFFEHCSLFSATTLSNAFKLAGFDPLEIRNVFGIQYLWLEAKINSISDKNESIIKPNSAELIALAHRYGERERESLASIRTRLKRLKKEGAIAVWGAGAKGVTFVNLFDPNRELVDCLVDLNPNKQGKYIAGTAHPICSASDIKKRGIKSAIIMNPNYYEEIKQMLKKRKLEIALYLK